MGTGLPIVEPPRTALSVDALTPARAFEMSSEMGLPIKETRTDGLVPSLVRAEEEVLESGTIETAYQATKTAAINRERNVKYSALARPSLLLESLIRLLADARGWTLLLLLVQGYPS